MSSWRDTTCGVAHAPPTSGKRVNARRLGRHAAATTAASSSSTCATTPARCSSSSTPSARADAAAVAREVRNEFVLQAEGEVVLARARGGQPEHADRRDRDPGRRRCAIVSRSEPLPFQIGEDVDEVLRLSYRWLDMRSDRMQRNLRLNHTVIAGDPPRRWTTSASSTCGRRRMTKGTPEGARDFLVPVRLQPGQVLRARAVAAALQAALHGRRARPLLPDRDVLARRGSPRRPAVRVPAARPRDVVRRPRGRARRAGAARRRRVRGARAASRRRARSRA